MTEENKSVEETVVAEKKPAAKKTAAKALVAKPAAVQEKSNLLKLHHLTLKISAYEN